MEPRAVVNGSLSSARQVARIVRECLEEGKTVVIDGLGSFRPQGKRGYVSLGAPRLPFSWLTFGKTRVPSSGFATRLKPTASTPGLTGASSCPGKNWPRSIEDAIEATDFVVACFSQHSATKKGGFQAEIRFALDCAAGSAG